MNTLTRIRPLVAPPAAQHAAPVDLLREAASAYDAQQDAAARYRELTIGREFRQRFGVTPEPPLLTERTNLSKSGVFTFRAAGLPWKGGDDGDGATKFVWFSVRDLEGSWHEASTKEQLGQLVRRGIQFEAATGGNS